ncbi:MAG: ABC transporter ATP-binding protein [Acidimicrobiia bacterium]
MGDVDELSGRRPGRGGGRAAVLEIDALRRSYGDVDALGGCGGLDLTVADGEIVGVLGPSGCGKTTLLRLLAGLEEPDTGTIRWDGHDLAGVPPDTRGFGLMFQDHVLFPHRDVAGNVAFGLRMQRTPRSQVDDRVAEVLTTVGLAGTQHRAVSTLSGGEQQRVALARALAPRPRLLMLDEPLGALDRALRERLVVDLRSILRDLGTTAVYVTHDQDEACTVADRVVVMRAGNVEQDGTPRDVWHDPVNAFVAGFLGWTDIHDGTGIRPGGVVLDTEGEIGAEVVDVLFQRNRFVVRVRTADDRVLTTSVADTPPSVGDHVHVAVDPDAVLTFGA